jgi:hypothetical protein
VIEPGCWPSNQQTIGAEMLKIAGNSSRTTSFFLSSDAILPQAAMLKDS